MGLYKKNHRKKVFTFESNKENFLRLWRITMENESAINTLFYEIDKLKKKAEE